MGPGHVLSYEPVWVNIMGTSKPSTSLLGLTLISMLLRYQHHTRRSVWEHPIPFLCRSREHKTHDKVGQPPIRFQPDSDSEPSKTVNPNAVWDHHMSRQTG